MNTTTGAELAVIVAMVGGVVILTLGTLTSILFSRLGAGMKFLWMAFVLMVPVFSNVAWFAIGRPGAARRPAGNQRAW